MRIAVFVDGANLFYAQKKIDFHIDLKKLLVYIEQIEKGEVSDAYYYIGQDTPPEAKVQAFLDMLPRIGYSLITKPLKTLYDSETGEEKQKANLDIEIVLDMFNTIESYDKAVLISGDGDFERPLSLLKARGKQIRLIATESMVARELRNLVGRHYIDLRDIRNEITKNPSN